MIEKFRKTAEEWEMSLPPKVFEITRANGTEPPFDNLYYNHYGKSGFYRCSNCGLRLFDAETQFDSGTGWPSFWQPHKKENIELREELETKRIAAVCARCGSHLGHVFDDGPEPTRLRFCMNSASLVFIPDFWKED